MRVKVGRHIILLKRLRGTERTRTKFFGLSIAVKTRIIHLYELGWAIRSISNTLGCSTSNVWCIVRELRLLNQRHAGEAVIAPEVNQNGNEMNEANEMDRQNVDRGRIVVHAHNPQRGEIVQDERIIDNAGIVEDADIVDEGIVENDDINDAAELAEQRVIANEGRFIEY